MVRETAFWRSQLAVTAFDMTTAIGHLFQGDGLLQGSLRAPGMQSYGQVSICVWVFLCYVHSVIVSSQYL